MVATDPDDLEVVDSSWLWHATRWVVLGLLALGFGGAAAGGVSVVFGGGILGFLVAAAVWVAALFVGVYLGLRGLATLLWAVDKEEIFEE
ncbi:hypothetical protein [halophilic archaeon]|uniref:hypothetical protein n=1 Tax=Halomicrococcus sp. SG-WS-1 TaxID=3439057 RepID=UPI000DDC433D|nr:hypothetical protein DMJ13_02490 [halophilic archaeon]